MKFASTITWSTTASVVKLATGFISTKFVSVIIGPLGVAMVGQFQNFISIVMAIALSGISSGLIKYTAEFKDNEKELVKIWQAITWMVGTTIFPTILVLLIFHDYLAIKLLGNIEYNSIFFIFAISLIFYIINNLMLNILNGLHEIKKYTLLNMTNSLIGLITSVLLVINLKTYGAILAIIVSQSVSFIVIIFFVIKEKWFKLGNFFGKFEMGYFKKLFNFTVMSIVTICIMPTTQIFVRTYLIDHTSWTIAGCWQGMQLLSNGYLTIVYTALSSYYLPKLSNLQDKELIKLEIKNGYKFIMPFVALSSLIIYLLRDFIINLLFAKSFSPMTNMCLWQFLGDNFKIASWLLGFIMIAKAKTKLYVLSEIFFGISFIIISMLFINIFGNNGAVMAFCLNYFIYFISFFILYKKGYLL